MTSFVISAGSREKLEFTKAQIAIMQMSSLHVTPLDVFTVYVNHSLRRNRSILHFTSVNASVHLSSTRSLPFDGARRNAMLVKLKKSCVKQRKCFYNLMILVKPIPINLTPGHRRRYFRWLFRTVFRPEVASDVISGETLGEVGVNAHA